MKKMKSLCSHRPLDPQESQAFCEQMAFLLETGTSALHSIKLLEDQSLTREERQILHEISHVLSDGLLLHDALVLTNVFPTYLVQMVAIGEETGTLDDVFQCLSNYYKKETSFHENLRNAMVTPILMTLILSAVILVLFAKVMPAFEQVFAQLGITLTGAAGIFLQIGLFVHNHFLMFLVVPIGIMVSVGLFFLSPTGKNCLMSICYRINPKNNFFEQKSAFSFAQGLYLSLQSGIPVSSGIKMAQSLVHNRFYQNKINTCQKMMENQRLMGQSFCDSMLFDKMHSSLLLLCDQTGSIDKTLKKITHDYEENMEADTLRFLSSIEPVMVVILSIITGSILFAVMLPLLEIISAI